MKDTIKLWMKNNIVEVRQGDCRAIHLFISIPQGPARMPTYLSLERKELDLLVKTAYDVLEQTEKRFKEKLKTKGKEIGQPEQNPDDTAGPTRPDIQFALPAGSPAEEIQGPANR